MNRPERWREMPVWRCARDGLCQEQWATWDDAPRCHSCDRPAEPAGFTWGEAESARERFLCEVPVHYPMPIPEVVQLSSLPQEIWVGLPVLHPLGDAGPDADWFYYDVGVVSEVIPDRDLPDSPDCRFIHSHHGTLRYPAARLWVPKVLADRLR